MNPVAKGLGSNITADGVGSRGMAIEVLGGAETAPQQPAQTPQAGCRW